MELQLLIKNATNVRYKDTKHQKDFLAQITHLSLDNKNIEIIENLDLCTKLSVLYLSENRISQIQGLTMLKNLTQLNLDDNKIFRMEGFDSLVNLRRLTLEKNCITRLEGLTACRKLEELYLSKQTLPPEVEFTFDEYSLAAISMSLKVLNMEQCNIMNPAPLYYLEQVVTLNMKDNMISEMDDVAQFLRTMNYLGELDLRGCSIQKTVKYRDQIVMMGLKLRTLDDKKIMDQERRYLYNLVQQKEMKAERATQGKMQREHSATKVEQNPAFTAPEFASKRQQSLVKPGNMSQQNNNPFGVTTRGYKGQVIKGQGKPPIMMGGGTLKSGNKMIQQAGLSVLGNQMTLSMNYDMQDEQFNGINVMNRGGSASNKHGNHKSHSMNINSGLDFSAGTTFTNTKHVPNYKQ